MAKNYENGVYSFQDVNLSVTSPINGLSLIITGAAEEAYSIRQEGDKDTLTMGAAGDGMHSLHAAQNGELMLRLLKTSILNQALTNAYNYQTGSAANHGQMTFLLTDPVRGDTVNMYGAAFKKFPDLTYAKEGGLHEWGFNVTRIEYVLGPGIITTVT